MRPHDRQRVLMTAATQLCPVSGLHALCGNPSCKRASAFALSLKLLLFCDGMNGLPKAAAKQPGECSMTGLKSFGPQYLDPEHWQCKQKPTAAVPGTLTIGMLHRLG